MKSFEPSFFNVENFILSREDYDYLHEGSEAPWHVAYNVNDPFFHIMGA